YQEAKLLLSNSKNIQNEIISEFGSNILDKKNRIDRIKLARISFQDKAQQNKLNSIVHPHLFRKINESFKMIAKQDVFPVFIVDGALIFESGFHKQLDHTIAITAHIKLRITRVLKKGRLTRKDILKRMKLQWSDDKKIKLADFSIQNSGTEKELWKQVSAIYAELV
ncbi:uncharacterized protein METZ01_LOCUS512990, partial [marine metagenome]